MLGVDIGPWRLHVAKDAPLQNNDVDCGIFVMKYIEAIYYRRALEFTVVCCTLKHYLLTYIIDYYIFILFSFPFFSRMIYLDSAKNYARN